MMMMMTMIIVVVVVVNNKNLNAGRKKNVSASHVAKLQAEQGSKEHYHLSTCSQKNSAKPTRPIKRVQSYSAGEISQ